ncbi:MAG: MarR family winged helix-turn-helix transcriptional regulator [Gemmiger sp.]|nr:MarR family winged helix-turn-helix transcriptional regulator [Gemmiger sp.]
MEKGKGFSPPRRLGGELHKTSHEIRRALDARIAAEVAPQFSGMSGMVLSYIVRCTELGGDVYQRDVEARFQIRRSSVTALLQGMEQTGLIIRCQVAQDARLKKLVPTPYGMACHHKLDAVIERFDNGLQQGMTPGETEQFRAMLGRLLENLHRMEAADTPKNQDNG